MKFTAEFKLRMAGLLSVFLFAQPLYASFEPLPVGGRAAGMGEAYSAIVDDVFSLYYNPAGVLQVNRPEVGTYYSKLYSGLTDNSNVNRMFFGYAQPFGKGGKMGGIGASYMALNLSGLYKEEALGLTYGQEFHHLWNVAGTLKILKKQIGSDPYSSNAIDPVTGVATGSADPLLAKSKSSSAMGLDLGMQYRLTQAYALGFAARNINSPDLAIGTQKDAAPAVYTFALARKMRNGSLDLEIMNWKATDNNMRFSLGGEHWFKSGLGLRAGGGFGSRNYSAASFGASYKMESIQFDYAAVLPLQGVQGTLGNQQISLTIRLGKPPVDPIEDQLVKEKEQRVKAETEARLAIGERDRLKKQLLDLTEAKSQQKQKAEEQAAQQALEEARRQAAHCGHCRRCHTVGSDGDGGAGRAGRAGGAGSARCTGGGGAGRCCAGDCASRQHNAGGGGAGGGGGCIPQRRGDRFWDRDAG
jgi:hypothetical protein